MSGNVILYRASFTDIWNGFSFFRNGVIRITAAIKKKPKSKKFFKQYEYNIILFIFLVLRFVFKNLPGLTEYFTIQPVFNLSSTACVILGIIVLLGVCGFLACAFGRLIRNSEPDLERPVTIFSVIFFACPASLPFLFDSANASGTQLLYPFALFVFAVCLIDKRYFKWLIPFFCAAYIVPSLFTEEIFFTALNKWSVLYVPLIILLLFFNTMKQRRVPGYGKKKSQDRINDSLVLFYTSLITSAGSYLFTLVSDKPFFETIFNSEQHLDWYLFLCLLMTAPALATAGFVLHIAMKNNFPVQVINISRFSLVFMLLFCIKNYYGLWIPFLILSSFSLVFCAISHKNTAMLSAVRKTDVYFSDHKFLLYFPLMVMASLSNVTSIFLSAVFQKLFEKIPY